MMKEKGECSYEQWREEWFLVSREYIIFCLYACAVMSTLSPLQFTFWSAGVWLDGRTFQHLQTDYTFNT
jgi:hypothetical protein